MLCVVSQIDSIPCGRIFSERMPGEFLCDELGRKARDLRNGIQAGLIFRGGFESAIEKILVIGQGLRFHVFNAINLSATSCRMSIRADSRSSGPTKLPRILCWRQMSVMAILQQLSG